MTKMTSIKWADRLSLSEINALIGIAGLVYKSGWAKAESEVTALRESIETRPVRPQRAVRSLLRAMKKMSDSELCDLTNALGDLWEESRAALAEKFAVGDFVAFETDDGERVEGDVVSVEPNRVFVQEIDPAIQHHWEVTAVDRLEKIAA